MITKNMSGLGALAASSIANGGGYNESVPMTRRKPVGLSRKQLEKDSDIAKELIYLWDIKHEMKAMLGFFLSERARLSHQRYWELLRTVWLAVGDRENYVIFRRLFSVKRPWKVFLMTPEEEAFLAALPDSFEVYRAAYPGEYNVFDGSEKEKWAMATVAVAEMNPIPANNPGLSWSLSKEWTEAYAKIHNRVFIERRVKKSEVTEYFNRRGENEIVIV